MAKNSAKYELELKVLVSARSNTGYSVATPGRDIFNEKNPFKLIDKVRVASEYNLDKGFKFFYFLGKYISDPIQIDRSDRSEFTRELLATTKKLKKLLRSTKGVRLNELYMSGFKGTSTKRGAGKAFSFSDDLVGILHEVETTELWFFGSPKRITKGRRAPKNERKARLLRFLGRKTIELFGKIRFDVLEAVSKSPLILREFGDQYTTQPSIRELLRNIKPSKVIRFSSKK